MATNLHTALCSINKEQVNTSFYIFINTENNKDWAPFFSPYFLYSPAHTPLKPSPSWVTNIKPFLLRAMSNIKTWRAYAQRHCLTELPEERQQNTWQGEEHNRWKLHILKIDFSYTNTLIVLKYISSNKKSTSNSFCIYLLFPLRPKPRWSPFPLIPHEGAVGPPGGQDFHQSPEPSWCSAACRRQSVLVKYVYV